MSRRKSTITVTLADLHLALAAAVPFAGEDEPSSGKFHVLHLGGGDGQFTVTATNGHVAGRVRKPATGQLDAPFHLDCTHAQLLRSALDFHLDVLGTMPVTLTVTDHWPELLLTVGIDLDFMFSFHGRNVQPSAIDHIFDEPADGEPVAAGETPLRTDRIAPFLQVADLAKSEPLRWILYGPDRQSYVRIGDWFTGVLMPVRPEAMAVTGQCP